VESVGFPFWIIQDDLSWLGDALTVVVMPSNPRVMPTWPSAGSPRLFVLRGKCMYNEPISAQSAKRLTRQSLGVKGLLFQVI
jgi:hypothetical protein